MKKLTRRCAVGLTLATVLTATLTTGAGAAVNTVATTAKPAQQAAIAGFDQNLQQRIRVAEAYAKGRPGISGIVLRDRQTGATWRSADAKTLIWACSVPKLAMVVDLLLRDDSRAITLTKEDRQLIHQMLNSSDDKAADTLWDRYGKEDFASRFPSYGLTEMKFTAEHPHRWGWIMTTADDLDRLLDFVLTKLPVGERGYIVDEMRTVAPNQQWGVWGAGSAADPGNKNGWSNDDADGSWITNSVGFVGPAERFTLSIMNDTKVVKDGFEVGKETTTEISRILFDGYFD